MYKKKFKGLSVLFFVLILVPNQLFGQIERFMPLQGGSTKLWRITNNPSVRHWANYHNTDAWSPDGRYVCYEKYEPYDIDPDKVVCIYDLHEDKETEIGAGENPRWANNHNWLFFVKPVPEDGPPTDKDSHVMWLDVDSDELTRIAYGVESRLGETDFDDRWLYGYKRLEDGTRNGVRIPIRPDSRVEIMEDLHGYQWIGNPMHPVIFSRDDHYDTTGDSRKTLYFEASRYWCDPDGENITMASPMIQRCHQSWSGDGEYLMYGGTGGTLISGRKWNEPFPSNLHVISAIGCGDISACGKSGRWVCGSGNKGPLQIVDLRSGDGWNYLKAALSYKHDSSKFGYMEGSGLIDNDSKGSADATKIVFVSDYDLKDGPLTEITENADASTDIIHVKSTEGFPASGALSIDNEVVGYKRKTLTTFEGLIRNMYSTTSQNLDGINERIIDEYINRESDEEFLDKYIPAIFNKTKAIVERRGTAIRKGSLITSFDARLIPDELRKNMRLPSRFAGPDFPDDKDSPLLWQRRTDVYIAVVRLPDQPHLNKTGNKEIELIPGENHWETYGYNIFKDGNKLTKKSLRPGETYDLKEAGTYTATAVEWSGLEGKESFPLKVNAISTLNIRFDKPADFSWTYDRWLVDGKEVSEEEAIDKEEAVKEIVHLVEGVIHREWYNWGQIEKRHDLNSEGKAIRRLFYKNGNLAKREYFDKGVNLVSRELFDGNGDFIVESMQFQSVNGNPKEIHHFWYENGCPVEFVGRGGRHAADEGPGYYRKEGDKWVKKKAL